MKKILGIVIVCLLSFPAFGQEIVPLIPVSDFIQIFIASLGGLKGASALAIVGIVLKLLFAFLNSKLAGKIGFMRKMKSGPKLFLILFISYASGIVTLMLSGLSFGAAVIHSTSMTALIVLLNQGYKKFIEKKKK